jgi:hypothetical protein
MIMKRDVWLKRGMSGKEEGRLAKQKMTGLEEG